MELRCVFLNCRNLYEPGAHQSRLLYPSGLQPRHTVMARTDLNCKIRDLAATIRSVFSAAPEIVVLSEVGSQQLGVRVGRAIGGRHYRQAWGSDPPTGPKGPETSLMVLYDPGVVRLIVADSLAEPRGSRDRMKWFPLLFKLTAGSRATFWLVANHWKSQLGSPPQTERARVRSAREIGTFYLEVAAKFSEAMILMGDFNCEPGDAPFRYQVGHPLRAVRERALVVRKRNSLAYFYNAMWRLLGEPDAWDVARSPEYRAPRLLGSYCENWNRGVEFAMWDQLLVTKPLLQGGLLGLRESSVTIVRPAKGCSDHGALGAVLEY